MKGGLAEKKGIKTYDDMIQHLVSCGLTEGEANDQMSKGFEVEKEHTSDESIAYSIMEDHLSEFPRYYDYLEKMEREMSRDIQQEKCGIAKTDFTVETGKTSGGKTFYYIVHHGWSTGLDFYFNVEDLGFSTYLHKNCYIYDRYRAEKWLETIMDNPEYYVNNIVD
jgi:hypothetical protein